MSPSHTKRASRSSLFARLTRLMVVAAAIVLVGVAGYSAGHALATPTASQIAGRMILSPTPSPAPTGSSMAAVAQTALAATVTIEAFRSDAEVFGTGWLFDDRGDYVTNAHVIADTVSIRVRDRAGGSAEGKVLGQDASQDIALVRASIAPDSASQTPLTVTMAAPAMGAKVASLASSRASGHGDVTIETVQGLDRRIPVSAGDVDPNQRTTTTVYTNMIEIGRAQIFPGNSGGPLLDDHNRVVGVVTLTGRKGNVAYAIPMGRILAELKRYASMS